MLSYSITYSFYNLDLNSLYFLWIYISYYGKLISFSFCPWSKYRWWVRLTRCRERFSSIYGLFIEKHGKTSLYHAIFLRMVVRSEDPQWTCFLPSLTHMFTALRSCLFALYHSKYCIYNFLCDIINVSTPNWLMFSAFSSTHSVSQSRA